MAREPFERQRLRILAARRHHRGEATLDRSVTKVLFGMNDQSFESFSDCRQFVSIFTDRLHDLIAPPYELRHEQSLPPPKVSGCSSSRPRGVAALAAPIETAGAVDSSIT
jgi:hypothetical protein